MKSNYFTQLRVIALLIGALVLPSSLLADGEHVADEANFELMAENVKQQVDVGPGFSTEKDKILDSRCINSDKPEYRIRQRGWGTFDRRWALAEMKRYFGLDISSEINFLLFKKRDINKFIFSTVENAYAESFTYAFGVNFGKKIHNPICLDYGNDGCTYFNDLGRLHLGNPDRFKNYCGDLYVESMDISANLLIQARVSFYNKKDKAYFEGKYDFALIPFARVSANIRAELASFIDLGEIQIFAIQQGGVPAELTKILDREVTKCRFDNMVACEETMAKLIDYTKEWREQIKDPTNDQRTIAEGYSTNDYGKFHHENPSSEPYVPLDVLVARMVLGWKFFEIIDDINTVAYNLTIVNDRNGYDYRRRLLAIAPLLVINMERVRKAGELCFDDFDKCPANTQWVLSTLAQFDRNDLDLDKNSDKIKKVLKATYGRHSEADTCSFLDAATQACNGNYSCSFNIGDSLCGPYRGAAGTVAYTCENNGGGDIWARPYEKLVVSCGFKPKPDLDDSITRITVAKYGFPGNYCELKPHVETLCIGKRNCAIQAGDPLCERKWNSTRNRALTINYTCAAGRSHELFVRYDDDDNIANVTCPLEEN